MKPNTYLVAKYGFFSMANKTNIHRGEILKVKNVIKSSDGVYYLEFYGKKTSFMSSIFGRENFRPATAVEIAQWKIKNET